MLQNPATGVKGEKEELYIGVFFENRYYKQKAMFDDIDGVNKVA